MSAQTIEECTDNFHNWLNNSIKELNESEKVQYLLLEKSIDSLKSRYENFLEKKKDEYNEFKKEEKVGFILFVVTVIIIGFFYSFESDAFKLFMVGVFITYLIHLQSIKISEKLNQIVLDQIDTDLSRINIDLSVISKYIKIENEYLKFKENSIEDEQKKMELMYKYHLFHAYLRSRLISFVTSYRLKLTDNSYYLYINI